MKYFTATSLVLCNPESELQVKAAYSVRLGRSVLETVSIREINLWNVAETGARIGHL